MPDNLLVRAVGISNPEIGKPEVESVKMCW
jgi:hypothetical protein